MRITNSTAVVIIGLICFQSLSLGAVIWYFAADNFLPSALSLFSLIFLVTMLTCVIAYYGIIRPLALKHQAIESGLANFKDNEFDISLMIKGDDALYRISQHYNAAAEQLRQSKFTSQQREILLDKIIQVSPIAMILVSQQQVIYSNLASQQLFSQHKTLDNRLFASLLETVDSSLHHAITQQIDGLFSLNTEHETQIWHLLQSAFQLNHQHHTLYLFKQLTREINQAEVKTWKKAIKIISHELNNSLAPILSMLHSARRITQTLDDTRLPLIFNTIEDRTKHLNKFVSGYAEFAKLPLPRKTAVKWTAFIEQLQQHYHFTLTGQLPISDGHFDLTQMEQVLLNILKNAHESGSDADDIKLDIKDKDNGIEFNISDKGSGMSQATLENALLPFYSTKPSGTGLGLGLCKEIIDAHAGFIHLHSRDGDGCRISIWLPK